MVKNLGVALPLCVWTLQGLLLPTLTQRGRPLTCTAVMSRLHPISAVITRQRRKRRVRVGASLGSARREASEPVSCTAHVSFRPLDGSVCTYRVVYCAAIMFGFLFFIWCDTMSVKGVAKEHQCCFGLPPFQTALNKDQYHSGIHLFNARAEREAD